MIFLRHVFQLFHIISDCIRGYPGQPAFVSTKTTGNKKDRLLNTGIGLFLETCLRSKIYYYLSGYTSPFTFVLME